MIRKELAVGHLTSDIGHPSFDIRSPSTVYCLLFLLLVICYPFVSGATNFVSVGDIYSNFRWDDLKNITASWNEYQGNLFYNNKNVGIGTMTPQQKLHVNGSAVFNGTINMGGNKIINLLNGTDPTDAVTFSQLQAINSTVSGDFVPYTGATKNVSLGSQTLTTTGNIVGNINASNITSGTLAVARGGTGATTFTAGRILFGAGTSAINTNSDLFWDNTNKRLGIGTAVPQQKFHVNGTNGGLLIDVDNAGTNHPVINTTLGNVTISSAGGSVIIKLG